MKLVYQLKHMYPTRPGNNYPYHLSDIGTRLVLLQVLLLVFHLRSLGKGIRLFLMLELSRSLYLQKEWICIGMYSWFQKILRPNVLRNLSGYESAGTRCSCCDSVPDGWLVPSRSGLPFELGRFQVRTAIIVTFDVSVGHCGLR